MLMHALSYAKAGLPVLPLHQPIIHKDGVTEDKPALCSCGKRCGSIGKHPRTKNGSKDATLDPDQIRKWWTTWPTANIGIATGHALPKGPGHDHHTLAVIDIDGETGKASLAALEVERGTLVPSVRTGGGGLHIYAAIPNDLTVRNSQARQDGWEGIDLRGQGGYVVAPPSIHGSGTPYRLTGPRKVRELEDGWLDAITTPSRARDTRVPTTHPAGILVKHGQRHQTMISQIGHMHNAGLTNHAIFAAMRLAINENYEDGTLVPDENIHKAINARDNWEATDDPIAQLTTIGAAVELLATLDAKLKDDPGAAFKSEMIAALFLVGELDAAEAARADKILRKHKVPRKIYDNAMKQHRAAQRKTAPTAEPTPLTDLPFIPEMPDHWLLTGDGVYATGGEDGNIRVLPVPLTVTRRLVDVVDRTERVELQFTRDGDSHKLIVDRTVAAGVGPILALADRGLPITSGNAMQVVNYLHALEAVNLDQIPREDFTAKAGWIGETSGRFFPGRDEGIGFEPGDNTAITANAFKTAGALDAWIAGVLPLIKANPLLRLNVMASLAAPLLKPAGQRSSVVHTWGQSAGGKTASMHAAASVWGAPNALLGNFNTTAVGLEMRLALLNGLPAFVNERQAGDKALEKMIYMVAEGQGRTRGAKAGGLRKMTSWETILLTNGEEPLVGATAPEGARTRTLEFEGRAMSNEDDARSLYPLTLENHGWAGRVFIQNLIEALTLSPTLVRVKHEELRSELDASAPDRFASHTNAVALLALADELSDMWIFGGQLGDSREWAKGLCAELPTRGEGGESVREYEFLMGLIVSNPGRFKTCFERSNLEQFETWGVIENGDCFMVPNIFKREMEREHYRPRAASGRLVRMGLMRGEETGGVHRNTIRKRGATYVCIKLPDDYSFVQSVV